MHGGQALWSVQRRERRVWVLCSAAQQSRRGNGVFSPAGGSDVSYEGVCWREGGLELKLVVGDVTNPTGGRQSGRIEWGDPKPLPKRMSLLLTKVTGRSSLLLVAQVL
ncbi:trans-sialidase [Trypanosoma cruzi]|nr:trans-sialidase [Trypanosoma cruzi]